MPLEAEVGRLLRDRKFLLDPRDWAEPLPWPLFIVSEDL